MNQQQLKDRFSSDKEWNQFEYYLLDGQVVRTVRELALAMRPDQTVRSMRGDKELNPSKDYNQVWATFISLWNADRKLTLDTIQMPSEVDQYQGRVD